MKTYYQEIMKTTAILCISLVSMCIDVRAQYPIFYQSEGIEIYNNPAYIGLNKSLSLDLAHRNQWPEFSGNYLSSVAIASQYLGKGNGVSISFFTDNAADIVKKREMAFGYGKQINFGENHFLSLGIQGSFFGKYLDPNKLVFGETIDPQSGFAPVQEDCRTEISGFDAAAGLMYFNRYFYLGGSAKHLLQPQDGFLSNTSRLDIIYFGELGGKIRIGESLSLVPYMRYRFQGNARAGQLGLKALYKFIQLDLGLQNETIFYGGLSYQGDHFSAGYNLVAYTWFSNEVHFAHEFILGVDLNLFGKENENFFDF